MFPSLFYGLRAAKVPVSLKEYLMLMEALDARVAGWSVDDFYYIARASLVKDERYLDRFDRRREPAHHHPGGVGRVRVHRLVQRLCVRARREHGPRGLAAPARRPGSGRRRSVPGR